MHYLAPDIKKLMQKWDKTDSPGIALAVTRAHRNTFQYYHGQAVIEHDIPINGDTVFYLCSLSKQFTAACLAFLIDAGVLSLDDPLRKFFLQLPAKVYDPVKICHLLHMSSGIHEWYDMMEYSGSYADEYPWRKNIIPLVARQQHLNFVPGESFSYCNTNYSLLTLIIEMITQKSLAEYAFEMIFQPLGMDSTFFCEDNNTIIKHLACGYYKVADTYKKADQLPPLIGAGGIYSCLKDMTIWLNTLISRKWHPEIFDFMFTPQQFNNGQQNPYLCGFQSTEFKGRKMFHHGGSVPGFFTNISFFPNENAGFVWLANHNDFKPDQISNALVKMLESDFSSPSDLHNTSESQLPHLQKYAGKYRYIKNFTLLELATNDNSLWITGNPAKYVRQSGNIYVSRQHSSNMIIIEEYYDLIILRLISENEDTFLVKTPELPSQVDLHQYHGRFHSSELNVTYSFSISENNLFIDAVKKFTGTDLRLIAADIFLSPSKGIKLRFQRDEHGEITSFFLDSFRSRNFLFQKIL